MIKFIYNYLSKYYYIKTSEAGNDGIYYFYDERVIPVPFIGSKLIEEVSNVFGLNSDGSLEVIISWALSIKPDINLEFYWKITEFDSILPVAMRVASHTIGLDLVSIQPLEAPIGELKFMDYTYGEQISNRNGIVYNEEVVDDIITELHRRQLEINIEDRDDSLISKALRKWNDVVGISSRRMEE